MGRDIQKKEPTTKKGKRDAINAVIDNGNEPNPAPATTAEETPTEEVNVATNVKVRELKNPAEKLTINVTCVLSPRVLDDVNALAKLQGMTRNKLLNTALSEYFEKHAEDLAVAREISKLEKARVEAIKKIGV